MKFYLFFGILAIYLNSFCGDPLIFTKLLSWILLLVNQNYFQEQEIL